MFFSRSGKDYTHLYGQGLASVIRENVRGQALVLDGEIVVWDNKLAKIAPFGMNKTIALKS